MRRSDSENLKAAVEWKPTGKRPRGRPKERWIDGIKQNLEKLGKIGKKDYTIEKSERKLDGGKNS